MSRKISQYQLGLMLSVSPQAVSKWENDLTFPDILLLPEIADLLKVSLDDLMMKKLDFK